MKLELHHSGNCKRVRKISLLTLHEENMFHLADHILKIFNGRVNDDFTDEKLTKLYSKLDELYGEVVSSSDLRIEK